MQLTEFELHAIKSEFNRYENIRSVSIEALKIVQKSRGWISDEVLVSISQVLGISVTDMEGIATFYSQIFRQPVGQHIIRFCDSIVCYITGYEKIKRTLECVLGISIGSTTQDNKFTLLPTCCLGWCDKSPVIMINEDVYSRIDPSEIIQVLRLYK